MKRMFMLLFLVTTTFLFARERQLLRNDASEPFTPTSPSSREEIILHEVDFEGDVSGWTSGNSGGWELSTGDSHSPVHSYNSPDVNDSGEFASYDLFSETISLPELGDGEIMHFKFWLYADMPDFIQEDDPSTVDDESTFLADYYGISIMDPTALAWHTSDFSPIDGDNWWCGDEEVGGYLDSWVQYLDTPVFTVSPSGATLSADMRWAIEDPAGAAIAGTCTDGWDQANVQISNDGGTTWTVINGSDPYDFDCGYGTIYNGFDGAPGWGGTEDWHNVSFDLSAWAGEDVSVRFAFYSDPAYSTIDAADITGFQVDNILVSSLLGEILSDTGDDPNSMSVSGEVWVDQLYDYGDETQPGATGWTEYLPGYPFNGNTYLDISDFAGKDVVFRFQTRYDGDHYSEMGLGGQGTGFWLDDFVIYKESTGSYPAPQNLTAVSGDSEVDLSWDDMNASGTEDFIYDSDQPNNFTAITMVDSAATTIGWAGSSFVFGGSSTVNSVDIYQLPGSAYPATHPDMQVCAFSTIGTLYSNEAVGCVDVDASSLLDGWNTVVTDWNLSGSYIIAHSFNYLYGAALDQSTSGDNSYFNFGSDASDLGSWDSQLSADGSFEGDWGIRANISYQSAGVTYSIYTDNALSASGLTNNAFTVGGLENNVSYDFYATATYPDGEESGPSNIATAVPFPQTVHEEANDDGTAEAGFNSGGSNYSAVKYVASAAGEDVLFFKWYQLEDGGAFYVKLWTDDNGPGEEIYSTIATSGVAGWNQKDISTAELNVSGPFWIGTKEFTSTRPFGLDTDSDDGMSYSSDDNWATQTAVSGNLMYRVFLDDVGGGGNECDGDLTGDGAINVLDVVSLVNVIMGTGNSGPCDDITGDGAVNVLDVVSLVNIIMGN